MSKITIHTEPLPDNSEKLYVFEDGSHQAADPFTTMMVITPTSKNTVHIHGAHGLLRNDINEAIGFELLSRGYEIATFEAKAGLPVTRWATLAEEKPPLAYYTIDLKEAARCIAQNKTL